jgi:hypothetical protein
VENNNDRLDIWDMAKKADINPSPFLATRVMAEVKASKKDPVQIWKYLTSTFALSTAIFCFLFIKTNTNHEQPTNVAALTAQPLQAQVISLEFNDDDIKYIAEAEIVLPDNVQFVSKNRPEISKERSIRLPLKVSRLGKTRLPFVISALEKGKHTLKLRFYNLEEKMVKEKSITVNFAANQVKSI